MSQRVSFSVVLSRVAAALSWPSHERAPSRCADGRRRASAGVSFDGLLRLLAGVQGWSQVRRSTCGIRRKTRRDPQSSRRRGKRRSALGSRFQRGKNGWGAVLDNTALTWSHQSLATVHESRSLHADPAEVTQPRFQDLGVDRGPEPSAPPLDAGEDNWILLLCVTIAGDASLPRLASFPLSTSRREGFPASSSSMSGTDTLAGTHMASQAVATAMAGQCEMERGRERRRSSSLPLSQDLYSWGPAHNSSLLAQSTPVHCR